MTSWFTADLHLGHQRILEYSERPFSTVEEMDEAILHNWNQRVDDGDTVFVLGDYAMGDRARGLAHLHRLHGTKVLIAGNHDKPSAAMRNGWKHQRSYMTDEDGRTLFTAVVEHMSTRLPRPDDKRGVKVLLSHYPYSGDHEGTEDRYSHLRLRDEGIPLLHGHIHDEWTATRSESGTPMINVGVDQHGYAPVSESEVLSLLHSTRE